MDPPQLSRTPPRPALNRQRSNSLPFTEPLQCSATEAAIMYAAERAVLNRRRAPSAAAPKEKRRPLSARNPRRAHHDNITPPQTRPPSASIHRDTSSGEDSYGKENRPDRGRSQAPPTHSVAHPVEPAPRTSALVRASSSPTAAYSAGLAKFIQGRLISLSTPAGPQPVPGPRSCPNLPQVPRKSRSQPNERQQLEREEVERPPLRSSFSAWSTPGEISAFEEDDYAPLPTNADRPRQSAIADLSAWSTPGDSSAFEDDDTPLPSSAKQATQNGTTNTSTPSVLDFYETSAAGSSFLLPDTPADDTDDDNDAHSMASPAPSTIRPDVPSRTNSNSTAATPLEKSRHASDATLDGPIKRSPVVRERSYFHAAASPFKASSPFKTLVAISPYEGQAFTRVYDMQVHGSKRIVTEGMAFDLFRELKIPQRHSRVL